MFVLTGFAIVGNSSHTTEAKKGMILQLSWGRILLNCKPCFAFPLPSKVTSCSRHSDPSPNPWIMGCCTICAKALQLFFSRNIFYLPTKLETVACVAKPFAVGHLKNVCFGVPAVQGTQSSVGSQRLGWATFCSCSFSSEHLILGEKTHYSVFYRSWFFFSVVNQWMPVQDSLCCEYNADGLGMSTFFQKLGSLKIWWEFVKISDATIMHLSPAIVIVK